MHYIATQTHKQGVCVFFLYSTKSYAIFMRKQEWGFLEENSELQIIANKAHEEHW